MAMIVFSCTTRTTALTTAGGGRAMPETTTDVDDVPAKTSGSSWLSILHDLVCGFSLRTLIKLLNDIQYTGYRVKQRERRSIGLTGKRPETPPPFESPCR